MLPIQYTCNFVLNDAVNNGIFSPGITPHQESFNVDPDNLGITNSSFTLASQTNTEKIYAFSATIPQTFSGRLIDIEVISGTYADIASPIVSLTQGESSNYSFSTSLFSPLLNKVEVDYDSIAINAPQVDDQNEVFINIQTELAILDFANYNNGSFTPFSQVQTGPIPTVIDVHVNSNCGPFSASFTNSTFSPSTDFEILSVTHDPTNAGGSFVTVSFAENTGGDRLGGLTITSDADSSVTDTIQILQLAANAAGQISVEGEWYIMMDNDFGQPSPTWFGDTANQGNGNSPGMVTDFNGIYRIPDIGVSTPQAYFSVNWNAMGFTLPVAITTSSISLIDTDTGLAPTWCNVFLTSPQQLGSATLLLEVDPNATGVIRTAHLLSLIHI